MLRNIFLLNLLFFSNLLFSLEYNGSEFTIETSGEDIQIYAGESADFKISCRLNQDYYSVTQETFLHQASNKHFCNCLVQVDWHGPKIPLYRPTRNGTTFFATGKFLEQSSRSKSSGVRSESFCVVEHRQGYLLIVLGMSPKKETRVWIDSKTVGYVYQVEQATIDNKSVAKTISRINRASLHNHPGVSLPEPQVLLTDKLSLLLRFDRGKYTLNNCGIDTLLAALLMKKPDLLNKWLENPAGLLSQLEEESLHNNPERLTGTVELVGTVGFLSLLVLTGDYLNPLFCMGSGAALGYGMGSLVTKLEKSVRKNIGIMPKKLEKLGEYLLNINELNHELQFVRTETDNFDEMLEEWRKIIEGGSPIIVLKTSNNAGHYVVIYSLLDHGEALIWDKGVLAGGIRNNIEAQSMESILDCKKGWAISGLSMLAGVDHRFVYFYFKNSNESGEKSFPNK